MTMSTKKPPTLPPPLDSVAELACWALAQVETCVADWPEGKRHVDATRRYLLARLRGQTPSAHGDDLAFTAALLARTLEADHGLATSEIVAILDQLDLPADAVPIVPREPPPAAAASPEP